ncbi:MAG: hypothetical protein ACRDWV_08875 [Acidimicrobiales bacterium]
MVCDIATLVQLARAIRTVPAALQWWEANKDDAMRWLSAGQVGEVDARLAEMLAPPAPDVIDFNWPPDKVSWAVDVPEGLSVGDRFLVGDGMGGRAWAKVIEAGGKVGVALDGGVTDPYGDLFRAAYDEAVRVAPAPRERLAAPRWRHP